MVVRVSGEDFGLLGGVTLDEGGHDTSSSLGTEGKRRNVEEKVLSLPRGVAGWNCDLDRRTIGYSLIRVDAIVGLPAVENVGNKFDDTGKTSGTTQDDFMDVQLVILELRTFSKGSRVPRKRSWQSSSKRVGLREVY